MLSRVLDWTAARTQPWILLLGRLAMGAIFVQGGFGKLMNLSGFAAGLAAEGLPYPTLWAAVAVLVEFGGGLAVVLGIRVRLAALLMAAFTIVAALLSHDFWTMEGAERVENSIQFMKNVAIAGGFLFLFLLDGGPIALDRRKAK